MKQALFWSVARQVCCLCGKIWVYPGAFQCHVQVLHAKFPGRVLAPDVRAIQSLPKVLRCTFLVESSCPPDMSVTSIAVRLDSGWCLMLHSPALRRRVRFVEHALTSLPFLQWSNLPCWTTNLPSRRQSFWRPASHASMSAARATAAVPPAWCSITTLSCHGFLDC